MLEALFRNVAETTLAVSSVTLLLLLFAKLFRKHFTAEWSRLLWIAVALQFVLPFHLSLPQAPVSLSIPRREIAVAQAAPQTNIAVSHAASSAAAGNAVSVAAIPTPAAPKTPRPDAPPPMVWKNVSVATYLAVGWLAGGLAVLLRQLLLHLAFRKSVLRWCRPAENPHLLRLYLTAALRLDRKGKPSLGRRRLPKLCLSSKPVSPMVAGFLQPKLILPEEGLDDRQLTVIFLHELTHFKRRDIAVKLLLLAAKSIHWFNPLVWGMAREADRAIELACDEAVLKGRSFEERKHYGRVLLDTMGLEMNSRAGLSTSFGSGKRPMKQRLRAALDGSAKRRGALPLALLAAAAFTASALVACNSIGEPFQTNRELNIEYGPYDERYLKPAVEKFKALYPDVPVNVTPFYESGTTDLIEYYQKLRVRIMAGKGPDILMNLDALGESVVGGDSYKIRTAGVYADLNEFIQNDPDFHPEEYNQAALKAGQFHGRQLLFPLSYSPFLFFSTEKMLETSEFPLSTRNPDWFEFADALIRYEKTNPALPPIQRQWFLEELVQHAGISLIDYERGTVNLDATDNAKRAAEVWKILKSYNVFERGNADPTRVMAGDAVFGLFEGFVSYPQILHACYERGEVPVFFPLRSADGKIRYRGNNCAGISNASPNKQNAWNLIKILLSPELQKTSVSVPVHLTSAESSFQMHEITFRGKSPALDAALDQYRAYAANPDCIYEYGLTDCQKIFDLMPEYFDGKMELNEAFDRAVPLLERYLSE